MSAIVKKLDILAKSMQLLHVEEVKANVPIEDILVQISKVKHQYYLHDTKAKALIINKSKPMEVKERRYNGTWHLEVLDHKSFSRGKNT